MAKYDIYNIESRLPEVSYRLKRIDWNEAKKRHEIIGEDKLGLEYIAMTVPFGKLDARVITRLKEIDPENGYNPFREIDKYMEQKERDEDRKVAEMAHSMADLLYQPLLQDAYG